MFKFLEASHSRVEAQFPTDDTDGIIPKSWFLQARDRYDANPQYWDDLATSDIWRLGLDVGDAQDNHTLAIWRGSVLYDIQIHPMVGYIFDAVLVRLGFKSQAHRRSPLKWTEKARTDF